MMKYCLKLGLTPEIPYGRSSRKHVAWLSLVLLSPILALAQELPETGDGLAGATLDEAVAEADRLDPGWRFKDLESHRVHPASAMDSAVVLGTTRERFSVPTSAEQRALSDATGDESVQVLDATARMTLTGFVERNRAVLRELRGLVDRPSGRFVFPMDKNWLKTPLPHLLPLRDQVRLLLADAMLRADRGDADGALESCYAAFCAARSLLDEPIAISQLVRIACDGHIQQAIHRVLDRGRPSEAALAMIQQAIADEVDQSLTLVAVRGERAVMFDTFGHLAAGTLTFNEVSAAIDASKMVTPELQALLVVSGMWRKTQAVVLELMTRLVEVYRKPPWTWHEGITSFERSLAPIGERDRKPDPPVRVARLLLPATSPLAHGELRTDALGRSLVLLIASKRYAMIHKQWPSSADALVPRFLPAVPTDPLTGKPTRLVMKDDKIIAYSVGIDGRDDGGVVSGSSHRQVEKSVDVGFALSIPGTE